jgi:hypothetical protein
MINCKRIKVRGCVLKGKMVRAPASRDVGKCPYSLSQRRGGFELTMECGDCGKHSSLTDVNCYCGVLRGIRKNGKPVELTLRSHVEVRYDQKTIEIISRIAEVLNRSSLLISASNSLGKKDQACVSCQTELKNLLLGLERSLEGMELGRAISLSRSLGSLNFGNQAGECEGCARVARSHLEDIAHDLGLLERAVIKGMFGIVGEENE